MFERAAHFLGMAIPKTSPPISCGLTSSIFGSNAREWGDALLPRENHTSLPRFNIVRTSQTALSTGLSRCWRISDLQPSRHSCMWINMASLLITSPLALKEVKRLPQMRVNGDRNFCQTEIRKFGDNLVKAAWTVSQLFNDGLFYRQPSVRPPIDEKCAETTTRPTREPAYFR